MMRMWYGWISKNYTNYTIKTLSTSLSSAPSFYKWCSLFFIYIINESYYIPSINILFLLYHVEWRFKLAGRMITFTWVSSTQWLWIALS
jgi:hypothetical protein